MDVLFEWTLYYFLFWIIGALADFGSRKINGIQVQVQVLSFSNGIQMSIAIKKALKVQALEHSRVPNPSASV